MPVGLLSNGAHFRLLYAPRGENTGHVTFPVAAMREVAGRPILGAFHLLLDRYRLLAAPSEARLPALLARSRQYQGRVSATLAAQVLDALYELLSGFAAADALVGGELLRDPVARRPNDVYDGLLTVLLRFVFLLFAEDRGLLPQSGFYGGNYSVHGLFERLRTDAGRYPDTMDQRFGSWTGLLALFRAAHGGCRHPEMAMPARRGHLFDPARFPFLEGHESKPPLLADGVVFRVLERLLLLDGERLSCRTLDVEQIGSVYQTMIGFGLEVARGVSIALRPAKAHGAPVFVDLDALLATEPAKRAETLQRLTDHKLTGAPANALKAAASVADLLAALEKKVARRASPAPLPPGSLLLQPTDERRRSGSHYTPRALTAPIVRKTLEPILARFGGQPTPQQILDLKVCDPAVGSGAFLVEDCRQLGDALVAAWAAHGGRPVIPPDEDELLHARRLVAQRCLYGVDRNPMATDLAKLSLWLATLARDHPLTFLDQRRALEDAVKVKVEAPDQELLQQTVATKVAELQAQTSQALAALRQNDEIDLLNTAVGQRLAEWSIAEAQIQEVEDAIAVAEAHVSNSQPPPPRAPNPILASINGLGPFRGFCSHPMSRAWEVRCPIASQRPQDDEITQATRAIAAETQPEVARVAAMKADLKQMEAAGAPKKQALETAQAALRAARARHQTELEALTTPGREAARIGALLTGYQKACEDLKTWDADLAALKGEKEVLDETLASLAAQHQKFVEQFSAIFNHLARLMLGQAVTGSIRLKGKSLTPALEYHGPRDSAALKVVRWLLFDLAALALGMTNPDTHHPRRLIHDSPRESDLAAAIYTSLFTAARELENGPGPAAFQYVVTTTESPGDALKRSPWLMEPILDASLDAGRLLGSDF